MFVNWNLGLILLLSLVCRGTYGYRGCPDPHIRCSAQAPCVPIAQFCAEKQPCGGIGVNVVCHLCPKEERDTLHCVTEIEPEILFECLSHEQICDGKPHCLNGEDLRQRYKYGCQNNITQCSNGSCIASKRLCRIETDCHHDEDVMVARSESRSCGENQFRCSTGICIDRSKVCNGHSDCTEGDDEYNCSVSIIAASTVPPVTDSCSVPSNVFMCSTSRTSMQPICIPEGRVCNGYRDCPSGDDEEGCENCPSEAACSPGLIYTCFPHPRIIGRLFCVCAKSGYRLTGDPTNPSTRVCADYDECKDSFGAYCSFSCVNTDGGFQCICPPDYTINNQTNTCRKINKLQKANLLVSFDKSISFYGIWNASIHHHFQSLTAEADHIQYDPHRSFVIYYNRAQKALLCHSIDSPVAIILRSDVIIDSMAYNAHERILFAMDARMRTLQVYTNMVCDPSTTVKMHSWTMNDLPHGIQSMGLDVVHHQIIFASKNQFLVANVATPNAVQLIHTTDRTIERFIIDPSVRRIFWTARNATAQELYPVYTCTDQFELCHDTHIRLPKPWPFAFFDDALIYSPISAKSLEMVQIYGQARFSEHFITSTRNDVRSLLIIDHHQGGSANLCTQYVGKRCGESLCLQINATDVSCLSVDGIFMSTQDSSSAPSAWSSFIEHPISSLFGDPAGSQQTNGKSTGRRRFKRVVLYFIFLVCPLIAIAGFLFKRYGKRFHRASVNHDEHQQTQHLSTNEPNLAEFNLMVEERNNDRLPLTNQLHY